MWGREGNEDSTFAESGLVWVSLLDLHSRVHPRQNTAAKWAFPSMACTKLRLLAKV